MKNQLKRLMLIAFLVPATAMAGGIVTNTNQSASFIRKPVQDAVIDATGTYYNPAGLAFLADGFHISISNQTISQTRKINSTFPGLKRTDFEGGVSAPFFPTVYGVFKTGNLALSVGVNPIGGGGSAIFENGLPSFEQQVAVLPTMLSMQNIPTSQYSMNAAFDGQSLNWGVQVNASYGVNEYLSFSAGVRYVIANNSYAGHLKDIMINPNYPAFGATYNGTNMVLANKFFSDGSTLLNTLNMGATAYAAGLQTITEGGGGSLLLTQGTQVGLDASDITKIQGIIMAAGQNPANINIQTAQAILAAAAPGFKTNADKMAGYAALTADKELDATQSGTGIVPIVGMNIKFSDDLNFAVKYEHQASITMTNSTTRDDVGMYPDGVEVAADMPSMLAMGLNYNATSALTLSGGFHYYFDKNADYGKSRPNDEIIDNNFWEAGAGVEYAFSDKFALSAGYLRTQTGVNDLYHSDLSHSLSTNSIGGGIKYSFNPNFALNLGVMNTVYIPYTKTFSAATPLPSYEETYDRNAFTIAVGVDIKF